MFSFLISEGFKKRGNTYFRIIHNQVLQIIKLKKERVFDMHRICVGVFSMYSEMMEDYFTAKWCIPQFDVADFIGKETSYFVTLEDGCLELYIMSVEEQLSILKESVLPCLNLIRTQEDIIDLIQRIEKPYVWNRSFKLSPFLATNDWLRAKMVVCAILEQHCVPTNILDDLNGEEKYHDYINNCLIFRERTPPAHRTEASMKTIENMSNLLSKIDARDEKWRQTYLLENQKRNIEYCKQKKILGDEWENTGGG